MKTPKTLLEAKADALWKGAKTAQEKTGNVFCKCDICQKNSLSSFCKVYHTINKKLLFSQYISKHSLLLTDHIFVCYGCRNVPNYSWISCNCKKMLKNRDTEDLCHTK